MSTSSVSSCVLHWFRRDLRLRDNSALHAALGSGKGIVPVYIVSQWKQSHHWTGAPRQEWLCQCLAALEKDIAAAGGKLLFRQGNAVEELVRLVRETGASAVYYNRDPDPFGRAVEVRLEQELQSLGVESRSLKDVALHEREEVLTGADKPYRVFTPYRRNWDTLEKPGSLPEVRKFHAPIPGIQSIGCPTLSTWGLKSSGIELPEAGENAAGRRMEQALERIIPRYADTRNIPGGPSTSKLSADLRMGTIGIRTLYHAVEAVRRGTGNAAVRQNGAVYLGELAWRDFYMQILWHFPEVLDEEFDPQWRGLPWNWEAEPLQRWQNGQTGFPIVDAGMRQLAACGWMHNRVRMITAMFLCKDLQIDWRAGEQFFMQKLIDGEIASNNGGWQWSAGTGADAAPYFRIQNPWAQTKSYDPEGKYIRQWVPELKDVPSAALLAPPEGGGAIPGTGAYPPPMVDHALQRGKTMELFQKHRKRHGA